MSFFSWNIVLQMLVVTTADKDSIEGVLRCYERQSSLDEWKQIGSSIRINVGEKGMALGRGIYDFEIVGLEEKKEGDKKAPAGSFLLGAVFGDVDHRVYAKKMPFLLITEDLECVDDPSSQYYNQFVFSQKTEKDWKSSEKMSEIGSPYALGIEVKHNLDPAIPGMGSCIFMHIWSREEAGSFGCTTMAEKDLCFIVSWLDQEKSPCLVQMPQKELEKSRGFLGLSKLEMID